MEEKQKKSLEEIALKAGARSVRYISSADIPLAQWPRMKCQYGCPNYGQTLCCPPYTPGLEDMQRFVREYQTAMLVEYRAALPDGKTGWEAFDAKINTSLLTILLEIERAAFFQNCYKAFALKAGKCRLCDTCNLQRCLHPDKARPSAEACGIDVFALAERAGYTMKVMDRPEKEFSIYGLVLLD